MTFLIPATDADDRAVPRYLYSAVDQGIDHEKSDVAKYVETLDKRHLAPVVGERLAKFEFHPAPEDVFDDIECRRLSDDFKGVLFYRACIRAMHDVLLVEEDGRSHYGISQKHEVVPSKIRAEIGMYAHRLSSKVAPDFFGLLWRTRAGATDSSTSGAGDDARETTKTAQADGP
ncbi:MAG: hypothetical protein ACYTBJ_16235 [Planctomycetota bacterium]|jgi:hypothetical protein